MLKSFVFNPDLRANLKKSQTLRKRGPLRGNWMAQWELGNIDNFLSMFGRKRLICFEKKEEMPSPGT